MSQITTLTAQRLGWVVIPARSLEEAKAVCQQANFRCDLALIDLMIPRDAQALVIVDGLLERRQEKNALILSVTDPEERQEAYGRVDTIDKRTQDHILPDGGVEFLRDSAGERFRGPSGTHVVVLSARRESTKNPDERRQLMEAVKQALGRPPEAWFDKPINFLVLERWLTDWRRTNLPVS